MAGEHMNLQSIIAIDPGEKHCGVAVFVAVMGEDGQPRLECRLTTEHTPEGMLDSLKVWSALYGNSKLGFDVMVVEKFVLYPEKAASLAWSEMRTVEVIGVLRERCRCEGVPFVLQPASIKKATEGMLRSRGIALKSRGSGGHAKDAELHGWCYWLRIQAEV
jgi:hypothetical protein